MKELLLLLSVELTGDGRMLLRRKIVLQLSHDVLETLGSRHFEEKRRRGDGLVRLGRGRWS